MLGAIWGCSSNNKATSGKPKEKRILYLIRHAKSSHKKDSLADVERPLSNRGKDDAVLMGMELLKQGITLDKMVISHSKRTKSTAKRLGKVLHFEKDSIQKDSSLYRCKTQALVTVIRNLGAGYKSVAIIGHNPSIIQAANHFQKDTIFTSVPTCGIIAIEFESDSWEHLGNKEGTFLFFDYPKKHKEKIAKKKSKE